MKLTFFGQLVLTNGNHKYYSVVDPHSLGVSALRPQLSVQFKYAGEINILIFFEFLLLKNTVTLAILS